MFEKTRHSAPEFRASAPPRFKQADGRIFRAASFCESINLCLSLPHYDSTLFELS